MSYTTKPSLLQRVCAGEESAWDEFYKYYKDFIRCIGRKNRLDDSETDELLQQTMLSLFEKKSVLTYDRTKGTFRAYLAAIIKHKVCDICRARTPAMDDANAINTPVDHFDAIFDAEYNVYVANLLLDELKTIVSANNFEIFQYLQMQDHTPEETAKVFEVPVPRIYTIRKRCLDHLKEISDKYRLDAMDEKE